MHAKKKHEERPPKRVKKSSAIKEPERVLECGGHFGAHEGWGGAKAPRFRLIFCLRFKHYRQLLAKCGGLKTPCRRRPPHFPYGVCWQAGGRQILGRFWDAFGHFCAFGGHKLVKCRPQLWKLAPKIGEFVPGSGKLPPRDVLG